MFLLRSAIVVLAVIAGVKGLTLPQPVKGPTKFANLAESLKINAGLAIQHLPNTDSIVAVWIEQGASIYTATAKGAILSTNGEIKTTFTVSESNVLSYYTPAVIIPRTNGSFSIVISTPSTGGIYSIRDFDSSGQSLSGPFPIEERNPCVFSNGVLHESSGDIFFVCTFDYVNAENSTEFYINAHRINSTGHILDTGTFQTAYTNSKPTIAVSGNAVAISTAILDLPSSIAILQVFRADIDNLTNADTFFPYEVVSLTISHQVIADPLNENEFVLIASSGLLADSSLFAYLVGIRFDRENTSIARTLVDYTDLALTLSVSVNEQGRGVIYLTTSTNIGHVVYPLQIKNENNTVIEIDTAQFDLVHTLSTAEKAVESFKDVRVASTTWSTGSAVVWYEISAQTSTFSVVSKIYGTYCGDNFAEGEEECDGGSDCNSDCTCPMGVLPDGNNGCGTSNPTSAPSAQPVTRPISVGPVATPSDETSAAHSVRDIALMAVLAITGAAALF
jgi:hypothetical protein